MTDGSSWLSDSLFEIASDTNHKTDLDVSLVRSEILERLAKLDDRTKLSLVEVTGTRGAEYFQEVAKQVIGRTLPPGIEYLFLAAVREMAVDVVRFTDGHAPRCHYCVLPVDPENQEETCKQATLWVSGPKSQNTRLRSYTGAWAHKACVEDRAAKPDTAQPELEW